MLISCVTNRYIGNDQIFNYNLKIGILGINDSLKQTMAPTPGLTVQQARCHCPAGRRMEKEKQSS